VPFPPAASEILRHAIGPAAARLLRTAMLLDPSQARPAAGPWPRRPDSLLEAAVGRGQQMAQTPAEVFSFSKRQLQQPARDRIAARCYEDQAVLAMWSSDRTRDAITAYLQALTFAGRTPGLRQGREPAGSL